ncbi:amino acid deaminase/aldolase [Corynebacterium sp. 4HC-13]|uniref:amino acid deaminase/aldolase n=1 Tax=Corynebacterium anserum TaxID=2684406 RepID=UPI00163B41A3|nr:amino acid deaminase/aldolase [Corynebacterium anserum]MBC2680893.1 amino acid deaminase/aldolase [Corynebacterium anserum]
MKAEIRTAVEHLDAPFAVLDLDAALANAADMVRRAAGTPIRLASKSIRIRQLISTILEQPGYEGVLAYNLNEAIWLVETGTSDNVLVAYPSAHKEAIHRLITDEHLCRSITLMVDSIEHLDFIDSVVPPTERGRLRICIDVDASLEIGKFHIGALRSPLRSAEEVRDFVRCVRSRAGFTIVGLMAYEGQIAGTTDTSPAIALMKKLSVKELAQRRGEIVDAVSEELRKAGLPPLEFVNGGGTGSIETTSAETSVTEIGAGSGIIGSALFDHYKNFSPQPAEWFVVPVVRRPTPTTVTVAGGGRVASGPVGKDRQPVVDWPEQLKTNPLEGFGEVQTPLTGEAARTLHIGDHVWMRPSKAGEHTEYIDNIMVVANGEVVDEWPTYRGEGRSFV